MPRGDGTGPQGRGPMTGRGAGSCSPNRLPGIMETLARMVGAGVAAYLGGRRASPGGQGPTSNALPARRSNRRAG
jgi:hypothetical protein